MNQRFSERVGIVEPDRTIQIDGMSEDLRNSLWNFIHEQYESRFDHWRPLARYIAHLFRKVPVDNVPVYDYECRKWVKSYFFELEWYEVYDLVEFLVTHNSRIVKPPKYDRERLEKTYNAILERELSGYRFVAQVLAPISSPAEADEIAGAAQEAARHGLDGARAHIRAALEMLGKKPTPEYRNSIKESISAVESVAQQISGSNKAGLADALTKLQESVQLHGALKKGFVQLYGYTSDSDGIRHAILDEPTVGFEEAKYMLVSCSAFVHYLISKADTAGLLKKEP